MQYQNSTGSQDGARVELFREFIARNMKIFAFANNHYAGHGPATMKLFWELWDKKQ